MQQKIPLPLPQLAFAVVYTVAICASAPMDYKREIILFLLQMAFLIAVILTVHRRLALSASLCWCLSFWGLIHVVGGLVEVPLGWAQNSPGMVWYSFSFVRDGLMYDQLVHAYGFGITTWLCWEVLRQVIEKRYDHRLNPTPGIVAICGVTGMGFGALNEVIEFAATRLIAGFDVGGYLNTGWDLVYNTLGAMVAGLLIYYRGRDRIRTTGLVHRDILEVCESDADA